MGTLFSTAHTGDDDLVTFEELGAAVAQPEIRTWLLAQELDIQDVEMLFLLIDEDKSGSLTFEELTQGLAYMKGSARSLEMHKALYELGCLSKDMQTIMAHLAKPATQEVKEIT